MGPVCMVEGSYGEPVMTNIGLMSFLTVFEGMMEQYLRSEQKEVEKADEKVRTENQE